MILVDTREQAPLMPVVYRGKQWVELPTERATLAAGDYTVRGLEHLVAVERKSISDLAGTLYGSATNTLGERKGHLERFRRELEALQGHARRWWLIEGSPGELDLLISDRFRRVSGVDAHSLVASIACDYGIPTIWAGDRLRAGHWLGVVLSRIDAQAREQSEINKAVRRFGEGALRALPWLGLLHPDRQEIALEHAARAARGERV